MLKTLLKQITALMLAFAILAGPGVMQSWPEATAYATEACNGGPTLAGDVETLPNGSYVRFEGNTLHSLNSALARMGLPQTPDAITTVIVIMGTNGLPLPVLFGYDANGCHAGMLDLPPGAEARLIGEIA